MARIASLAACRISAAPPAEGTAAGATAGVEVGRPAFASGLGSMAICVGSIAAVRPSVEVSGQFGQIGRAPCRERVCKFVVVLVYSVSCKKKLILEPRMHSQSIHIK